MKTYHVALSNRDCPFDEADGFKTFQEALEWASGRTGRYVALIDSVVDGEYYDSVSISVSNPRPGFNQYRHYTPWGGWELVTPAQIEKMI